jgi:murein DD-endopeptidase MepM/ murein hydrolase activator NlpD
MTRAQAIAAYAEYKKPSPLGPKLDIAKTHTATVPVTTHAAVITHPAENADLRSDFGPRRDPFTGSHEYHMGEDFPVTSGTEIHAPVSGAIMRAGDAGDGYGQSVLIKGSDGKFHLFAHLSALSDKLKHALHLSKKHPVFDSKASTDVVTVDADDLVGKSGSTGKSIGPHIHYGVYETEDLYGKNARPLNPVKATGAQSKLRLKQILLGLKQSAPN